LLDPGEPLLGQHEDVVGLHFFVNLSHGAQKIGCGLEHGQPRDRAIAIRRARRSSLIKDLQVPDESLGIQIEADARARAG